MVGWWYLATPLDSMIRLDTQGGMGGWTGVAAAAGGLFGVICFVVALLWYRAHESDK